MVRIVLAAVAAALALAGNPASAQQQQQPQLPPGNGHDIVAVACTQCHGAIVFMGFRMDADAWRRQIYDMVLHGAQIGPGDINTVVDYFATNFGPGINVPPSTVQVTLPAGSGQQLVQNDCVLCHGLDRVAATPRSQRGWMDIINRMVFYGAPVSGKDEQTVVSYLDANFGQKPAP